MGKENLYDKRMVIDYIWQYSRFYGNTLGDCERYFEQGEGYTALVLMFEVTENICKSVLGDYDSSFYKIVSELKSRNRISDEEEGFLSTNIWSVRKLRNLFAHANLMCMNLVNSEDGRLVYYPLSEQESCVLLYDKISHVLFNILLDIIQGELAIDLDIHFGRAFSTFQMDVQEFSVEDTLQLSGWKETDIEKMKLLVDDNTLMRLADNSSNINVTSSMLSNISSEDED